MSTQPEGKVNRQDLRNLAAYPDAPLPGAIGNADYAVEIVDADSKPVVAEGKKYRAGGAVAQTVKATGQTVAKGMKNNVAKGMKKAYGGMQHMGNDGVDYSKFFNASGMDLAEARYTGLQSDSIWTCFIPPMEAKNLPISLRTPAAFLLFMWCGFRYTCFRADHLVLSALAVGNTILCSYINVRMEVQISIVVFGTIFPLVFIIGANWKRRESATLMVSGIKATAITLVIRNRGLCAQGLQPDCNLRRVVYLTKAILKEIAALLPHHSANSLHHISQVYHYFDVLGHISSCDVDAPAHTTHMILRTMVAEFEKLRVLREYRTPWGLNYFCFIFGLLSPVVLGPYFANIGCPKDKDSCGWGTAGGLMSSWFFALVTGCLLSVIKHLEDPFDQQGVDDVVISFDLEADALLRLPPAADFDWAALQAEVGIGFLGSKKSLFHAETVDLPLKLESCDGAEGDEGEGEGAGGHGDDDCE